jgi:hypothetical protein
MMFLLMHTLFSLFLIFFFVCAGFFGALAFYILFFHKSAAITRYNSRVSKKISPLCYRFSALISTDCLTNIATSNVKTHNTKIVDLVILFIFYVDRLFWIMEVGDNDPENRLVRNFRISNKFTSKANNSLIMKFSGKLLNITVVDMFLSFLENTRTRQKLL